MPLHPECFDVRAWRARYCDVCDAWYRYFQFNEHLDSSKHAHRERQLAQKRQRQQLQLEQDMFEWEYVE